MVSRVRDSFLTFEVFFMARSRVRPRIAVGLQWRSDPRTGDERATRVPRVWVGARGSAFGRLNGLRGLYLRRVPRLLSWPASRAIEGGVGDQRPPQRLTVSSRRLRFVAPLAAPACAAR